ncbi:hypothetical protein K438DRAFT_1767105 [Mycena galopus ATCC 62051]|nr:hypothetical protein K438DRAFT_1767105 [Mycena galopus ATCC 62051]
MTDNSVLYPKWHPKLPLAIKCSWVGPDAPGTGPGFNFPAIAGTALSASEYRDFQRQMFVVPGTGTVPSRASHLQAEFPISLSSPITPLPPSIFVPARALKNRIFAFFDRPHIAPGSDSPLHLAVSSSTSWEGKKQDIACHPGFAAPLFSSRKCGTSSSSNGCPTAFSWVTPDLNSDDGWFDAELSSVVHHCRGVADCALIGDLSAAGLLSVLAHIRPMYLTLTADDHLQRRRECRLCGLGQFGGLV